MKKNLLLAIALVASVAATAQSVTWPCTVSRADKTANTAATVTGSTTITGSDIALGSDIAIQQTEGANAIVVVKNAEGAAYDYPNADYGMIGWQPIQGHAKDADGNVTHDEGTLAAAISAGAYVDFTLEETDITKDLTDMSSIEFYVTKAGTDAVRCNAVLYTEGDEQTETILIDETNAYTFGDEYNSTEAGNKANPWDAAAVGYNPSRNDGGKGVSNGANPSGISHVTLAIPEGVLATNPYKATLRIAVILCANNKQLGLYNVKFNFGGTAVQGVAEAKAEAKAPVKVITANGVQIGNYNVAGQQVK